MRLISAESLHRPEVARWHTRIKERYTPPAGAALTVVLPCSARKPYSKSRSHFHFINAIKRGGGNKKGLVHEVILTSPLGMVPRELEGLYPAAHYDVPVTGQWSQEEKDFSMDLMADYMAKAGTKVIAHVDGAYRDICSALDIPMTTQRGKDGARQLEDMVRDALKDMDPRRRDSLEPIRKIADFQFGPGAGDILVGTDAILRRRQVLRDRQQICAVNPKDGFLSLSLKGMEYLKDLGRYWVKLSFKPKTRSIFAVGVEEADLGISPGDEVLVFYDGEVVGVGRSVLSGREMVRATKGLAINLRHKRS